MAKISLDLNQFKANGVYTVEFDASESFVISSQQLRLIVGFSRKGPFNAPVFLQDIKSAKKIFGEIDTFLEKKGSFFHRALETALQQGPVFALNLMPLNNTPTGDKIDYRSFSLSMSEDNSDTSKDLLASFFNKERFWFPDSTYFEAVVNNNAANEGKLISFTNLGQSPVSLIVRKAANIKGFDITARDFYGDGNAPAFVNDFDYISDYFIDIIVVKGDWTNYANLSIDPDFSTYFDKTGIKVDKLNAFLASEKVTAIANFTGCIIPDFVDKQGTNQYIETIVNNSQGVTGIFMTINRTALDDYETSQYHVDLIGHSLIDNTRDKLNMLSYVSPLTDELGYSAQVLVNEESALSYNAADFSNALDVYPYIKSVPYISDANRGIFLNTLVIPKPRAPFTGQVFTQDDYNNLLKSLTKNSLIKTSSTTPAYAYVKVDAITNTGTSIEILYSNPGDISNPAKGSVATTSVMTITAVDTLNNIITTTNADAANLSPYDMVYIKGINKYFVVESVDTVGSDQKITLFATKADAMSGAPAWIINSFNKTLDTTMTVTSAFVGKDSYGCFITDEEEVVAEIVAGTPNEIAYIASPSLLYLNTDNDIVVMAGNKLYTDVKNNSVINGDFVSTTADFNTFNYLSFVPATGVYGLDTLIIKQWATADLISAASTKVGLSSNYSYTKAGVATDSSYWDGGQGIVLYSAHNKIAESVTIVANTLDSYQTSFFIAAEDASKIEVGQYLVTADVNNPRLTRVVSKTKIVNAGTNNVEYQIKTNEAVRLSAGAVTRYLSINDINFTTALQFTALSGFAITTYHLPGSPTQLEKILGVIENTNLSNVLADKDMIQFRYLVDTFGGGLAPMMGPKSVLSRLAKKRQKCMAILNAPSIAEFIASTDPRFTDIPTPELGNPKPVLQAKYIADGANLTLGPSYRFTLPDDDNGAKHCGVFTPFIKIRENNKNIFIPPSSIIINKSLTCKLFNAVNVFWYAVALP
jgi:hypothetical protein